MTATSHRASRALAPLMALSLALVALVAGATASAAATSAAAPAPAPARIVAAPPADYSNVSIGLTSVMSGLNGPILVTNAGDRSRRLFVVEQRGVIKVWRSGRLSVFLDMRARVELSGEQGLLALAFHPAYERNRKFYVLFTEKGTGDVIVAEYKASTGNRNKASTTSFRRLLRVGHRVNTNHNGGMLAFGSKGYLYISIGDGGGGGDAPNNAQNRRTLLGKIVRIDVNGRTGRLAYRIPPNNPYATSRTLKREIWSYGLRNPWRFSFDRLNGDLWIGDVGQSAWEEIDRSTRAGGGRGVNYGWRIMEGNDCFQPSSGCDMTGLQKPIAVYDHAQGCAVIGGYVYRGPLTLLKGAYLFSDVCSGTIWSIVAAGPSPQTPTPMASTGLGITSFGEGESGTVYVTAQDGHVYRLTATARP
ncbi:MAG: PQQ-dependent sugar dehydrogenase [Chloroflexota bacterium]|nr:PQQ-dependent sugar dehydrogenase [Chloroflexota bacterium]